MPRQNRVTPYGELVATPERGLVFGNRGCLHDQRGRIVRRWVGRRWIACRLQFRVRRRELMPPGGYTGLFFTDEATAFAAGHRPCAECRHEDYRRFADWWSDAYGERGVTAIDQRLHAERLSANAERRLHPMSADDLPDATMIDIDAQAWLIMQDRLWRWTFSGYRESVPRPSGAVEVITPPALVGLLRSGWTSVLPLVAS